MAIQEKLPCPSRPKSASAEQWLDEILPRHERLTKAVVSIVENIFNERGIEYLAITGRTKNKESALEKIKRKGYTDPQQQLTDLSGIRIVLYFESHISKAAEVIAEAFSIDTQNSLNKDSLLSANQIGYRSVHYVCDLGDQRKGAAEYKGLLGLKFEFQVRTVLQHAWAELAHDRNYKFSGKLPKELERKLYLYAGLLEIADKGFDETAKAIDIYANELQERTTGNDLEIEVTSLSLNTFVNVWAERNKVKLAEPLGSKDDLSELVRELNEFKVTTLSELQAIIPKDYAEVVKTRSPHTTIYGLIRDWMLITDWRRFKRDVKFNWVIVLDDDSFVLNKFLSKKDFEELVGQFECYPAYVEEEEGH